MSDPRYRGGVLQGMMLSREHESWPDEVPGLGRLHTAQPFGQCIDCAKGKDPHAGWTWRTYGAPAERLSATDVRGNYLCASHAWARAKALPKAA